MAHVEKSADTQAARIDITPDVLKRYDRPGPRYTSYPTAPVWKHDFGDEAYRKALTDAGQRVDEPLSLYVHIPFCHERCAFCGCNVIISRKEGVADTYLHHVAKELQMVGEALGDRRQVMQLHWGGGTPTFLRTDQMTFLFDSIKDVFNIESATEMALELDPRVTSLEQIQLLRKMGFNRASMGVQDLDPEVQCAIHRNQTEEQTRRLFKWCREAEFDSVNLDLVYGLPGQRVDRWKNTIEKIIDIQPDRLAIYSYAHLPDKLRNQKRIDAELLPTGPAKYELLAAARTALIESGYVAIGMDHFARPDDELAVAMRERRLHRNFMGYTVVFAPDMIGVGTSAIGEIGGAFAQNEKKLSRYYQALDADRFATACGCVLSRDDAIRSWVIRQLTCNFYVDFDELAQRFGVEYDQYFAEEEAALVEFYEEQFVSRTERALTVLPMGQVFIRNVAMVFDAYLRGPQAVSGFSRTV